ncbi:MAG TPA: NUDIX hydrolase [Vicinamibacteria bacterium]|nr:NUDIX hydrolase [Vicinamibacteria bacterium]
MHIGRHIVQELVYTFGEPLVERWDVPLTPPEMDEVERHRNLGRAHDVSLVIQEADRLAVIRKPGYPEGAYRIPSGGIHPEESFVDGAIREALEETGLTVRIEDYLLQIHANFTCDERSSKWTTHVMLARREEGELVPRDSGEIESARWASWRELIEDVNPRLVGSGLGGLAYRARLHRRLQEIVDSA